MNGQQEYARTPRPGVVMMSVDLRTELVKHTKRAEAIMDQAAREYRDLTAREMLELDDIDMRAREIENALSDSDPNFQRTTGRRTAGNAIGNASQFSAGVATENVMSLRLLQSEPFKARDYATLFRDELKNGTPPNKWASLGEFVQTVAENRYDPRLIRASSMNENSGGDGGFLVPTQFGALLLDQALMGEIVRPRALVSPMTTNNKLLAGFDYLNGAPFAIQWVGDSGTISEQKGSTVPLNLIAHKAAMLCRASNSLTEDAPEFNGMLNTALTKSISYGIDSALFNGSGAGMPLGIFNSNSIITIAKESGQAANTILYANILKMFSAMHPALYSSAVWVVSPSVLPQLLTMVITAANATTVNVAVIGQNGQMSVLGRPLVVSPHLKPVGDLGDILFCDMSQYIVGLRRDVTIAMSPHAYFTTDELGVRLTMRLDGRPAWDKSFTDDNGGKLSWAVTLAARA